MIIICIYGFNTSPPAGAFAAPRRNLHPAVTSLRLNVARPASRLPSTAVWGFERFSAACASQIYAVALMPFVSDVMCESAAESPWLPGWNSGWKAALDLVDQFSEAAESRGTHRSGPSAPNSSQLHGWFKALHRCEGLAAEPSKTFPSVKA